MSKGVDIKDEAIKTATMTIVKVVVGAVSTAAIGGIATVFWIYYSLPTDIKEINNKVENNTKVLVENTAKLKELDEKRKESDEKLLKKLDKFTEGIGFYTKALSDVNETVEKSRK